MDPQANDSLYKYLEQGYKGSHVALTYLPSLTEWGPLPAKKIKFACQAFVELQDSVKQHMEAICRDAENRQQACTDMQSAITEVAKIIVRHNTMERAMMDRIVADWWKRGNQHTLDGVVKMMENRFIDCLGVFDRRLDGSGDDPADDPRDDLVLVGARDFSSAVELYWCETEKMNVLQLRKLLTEHGWLDTGKKPELVERACHLKHFLTSAEID